MDSRCTLPTQWSRSIDFVSYFYGTSSTLTFDKHFDEMTLFCNFTKVQSKGYGVVFYAQTATIQYNILCSSIGIYVDTSDQAKVLISNNKVES